MRIATWNVERLKHWRQLPEIVAACEQAAADILILTETDARIRPAFRYCFQTLCPAEIAPGYYAPTERRVAIFTNYECVRRHATYDKYTALCVELATELGNLCVYGTIMGVEGNRRASFREELPRQLEDIAGLAAAGHNICVGGDFNLSFADNYYFTHFGRDALTKSFTANGIRLLTANVSECIDHIAVSERCLGGVEPDIAEWNQAKSLSDHKGIVVTIAPPAGGKG